MDKNLGNVNFSAVLKAGIGLLVAAVIIHVLLWGVFEFLQAREAKQDAKPSPMFQKDQRPPGPQLQVNEAKDYQTFIDSQNEILNSYGWVNTERGVVRIPITEAMKLVIEREKTATEQIP